MKKLILESSSFRLPYRLPYGKLDKSDFKWKVGLIVLATDNTTEQDFLAMRASKDLVFYTSRVNFKNPLNKENLIKMKKYIRESFELILPSQKLDAVVYSCTAASTLIGQENLEKIFHSVHKKIPVISPISAVINAFKKINVKRINLLTPYSLALTQTMENYFRQFGIEVVKSFYFNILSDQKVALVKPSEIYRAGIEAMRSSNQVDGLFISCTALRAINVIHNLEQKIKKPVITSNQAMYHQLLKIIGCNKKVNDYGMLLEKY